MYHIKDVTTTLFMVLYLFSTIISATATGTHMEIMKTFAEDHAATTEEPLSNLGWLTWAAIFSLATHRLRYIYLSFQMISGDGVNSNI